MMKLNSKTLSILMMAGLLAPNAARARYIRPQLEATPVDRLVKNLSEQLKAKPKDVTLRFNLARVHAMAFALKTDQAKVRSGKANLGAWFGYAPRHVPFKAVKTQDSAKIKAAKAQLELAKERYEEVLKMNSKHLSAQLGYGWCLEQAAKRARLRRSTRRPSNWVGRRKRICAAHGWAGTAWWRRRRAT